MRKRTVVIVGCGPVGLCAAALLGQNSSTSRWRIYLIDPRSAPTWDAHTTDLRVYALSRASQNILAAAGVWDAIVARRASPYRRMVVWEGAFGTRPGTLSFDSAEIGEPDLGHIVEDGLIRHCLGDTLQASTSVELMLGAEITAVDADRDRVAVTTNAGATIDADLLIAADGAASTVRSLLDLPVFARPYGQEAVVAHVATERPHAETAWQRFLATGPVALLPLADGRSSVVWSTTIAEAARLREAVQGEFADALEAATDGALGAIEAVSERRTFPLQLLHTPEYCRARVALIGDAAHTIHPLAGQGMNLGLLDAAVLAEAVLAAVEHDEDPGDLRVLRRYERTQKGRNLKTLLAMDTLHRLFARSTPALASLRAAGMTLIDSTPAAKRMLMREALGLGGELPASAQRRVA